MKVQLSAEAKLDLKTAAEWYENQQKGLGKRFTSTIRRELKIISQNPQQTSFRYKNIRTAVVTVFPYMIHFYIDTDAENIIIVGIFHTSLNPKNWNTR